MKSFDKLYLECLATPYRLITIIRQIGEYKGRQELYKQQATEMLENPKKVAVIQSMVPLTARKQLNRELGSDVLLSYNQICCIEGYFC